MGRGSVKEMLKNVSCYQCCGALPLFPKSNFLSTNVAGLCPFVQKSTFLSTNVAGLCPYQDFRGRTLNLPLCQSDFVMSFRNFDIQIAFGDKSLFECLLNGVLTMYQK